MYTPFLSFRFQSIRKKSVTMQHVPSAVFHYSDTGGHSSHCKVNAIFQAAKKDLLKIIQLQVTPHYIHPEVNKDTYFSFSQKIAAWTF